MASSTGCRHKPGWEQTIRQVCDERLLCKWFTAEVGENTFYGIRCLRFAGISRPEIGRKKEAEKRAESAVHRYGGLGFGKRLRENLRKQYQSPWKPIREDHHAEYELEQLARSRKGGLISSVGLAGSG